METSGFSVIKRICIVLSLAMVLTGCGKKDVVEDAVYVPQISSMGIEETAFEYQEQKPLLVVDSTGYGNDESKILYADHNVAGETFSIINVETGNTVFEGTMYNMKVEEEIICYGDFSQFDTPGEYVAYLDKYGYSYKFRIGDDTYASLYDSIYERLKHTENDSIEDKCYMLNVLMLSSELYGENYTDWVYIVKEVDDISREVLNQLENDNISYSSYERCCLAGMLAQFGTVYFDINEQKALEKSEIARQLYETGDFTQDITDANYYAMVYLYSATGDVNYLSQIHEKQWKSGEFTFFADMGYIMSERTTDYNRCEQILNNYLDRDEEIFGRNDTIGESFVKEIKEPELLSAINELMVLGVEDYAYSRDENEIIRRNFIHYICGCNKEAKNLLAAEDSCLNDVKVLSKLIFIMGTVSNQT